MSQLNQLQIDLKGIASVLKDKRLRVPKYQREYSWGNKNVQDLFNDLETSFMAGSKEYFLGTIVLTEEQGETYVVDGQQRLTTISLLIVAIRDYLKNQGDAGNQKRSELIEEEYLYKTDLQTLNPTPNLKLNDIDNNFYIQRILGADSSSNTEKPSHERLIKAYEIARKFVSDKFQNPENTLLFIEYIAKKVKVILLSTPDEANAFILFETLNDRGLELATSDLLKNYLFSKAGDRIDEVRNSWLIMQTALENVALEDLTVLFIRHLWISEHGLIREKDLYPTVKRMITGAPQVVQFGKKLESAAKRYVAILESSNEFWDDFDHKVRDAVKTLDFLNMAQPRPLILSILSKFEDKEIAKALPLMVTWSIRLTITGKLGGQKIEDEYASLAKKVSDGEITTAKSLASQQSIIPSDSDFKEAFSRYRISNIKLARFYLIALESELRKEAGTRELIPTDDPDKISLEHILPKTLSSDWESAFDLELHKDYVKRLGNMTILDKKLNNDAKNGGFLSKNSFYADSELSLNKDFQSLQEWTASSIETRQQKMAELAAKIWQNKVD
jgi:hypothetical protein